ncbi:hypothetical protein M0E87_04435 [Corynebacterium sp. CCM 9185]|uniref:Uncharacterized protein n=1 Tax=Corynebacterium marambiense TaxID=2765364 RepID=A0ABS0VZR3_9CORY|nr:hypothetical protein [Corynebacterium marambiense]MBI9000822.1 hypothetical protein [Corynebacterium marambiense]MCK7662912.1 hypothetical protein [Corynebacterium marambiense]
MRTTTFPDGSGVHVSTNLAHPLNLRLLPFPVSRFPPTGHVGIALSAGFAAGICAGDRLLTEGDLLRSGIPVRTAWDRAAAGALEAARTSDGVRVYVRTRPVPGYPGSILQVAVPGRPTTDWLAHPETFTTIDRHLTTVFGKNPVWFAPRVGELYATTGDHAALQAWATRRFHDSGLDAICPEPIHCTDGFPVVERPAQVQDNS